MGGLIGGRLPGDTAVVGHGSGDFRHRGVGQHADAPISDMICLSGIFPTNSLTPWNPCDMSGAPPSREKKSTARAVNPASASRRATDLMWSVRPKISWTTITLP